MPKLTGTTIGRYRLLRCIATNAMSEVYLAWDRKTAQRAAIKFFHVSKDDYYAHFQREVSVISALRHEHILPALDYGRYKSWLYLVTPYIEQGTLDERLTAGPLAYDEASEILRQLADALQFAHEHGVIHCDIKPSNVLLAEGMHSYLADFGLVKSEDADQNLTRSRLLVGAPAYMAPEMVDGLVTPASDIYSLGVLLYQMLTGQLPFPANMPLAMAWKRLHEELALPSTLNPALSIAVDDVILHALEKDPDKRFETPRELAVAYQNALDRTVDAVTEPVTQPFNTRKTAAVVIAPTMRKKKKKVVLLTAGLGAGLCFAVLLFGISAYGLQYQPSANLNIPNQPTAVSTPRQANPPATGADGGKTQRGNTAPQGGSMYSQARNTSPQMVKPTPPLPTVKPTPPAPAPTPPTVKPTPPAPAPTPPADSNQVKKKTGNKE